jgi:ATP-dependent Clp protease ATP-binding subunit ClpC
MLSGPEQIMFERYTQDARRAIFFARWEAQQSGSAYIEPEHLLLSLTHDVDSKANQLFALSVHAENFRKQLGFHNSAKSSTSDLPLSNAGKRVLAYAAEEAERLASKPIGTEHLLLGLLRGKKSDVPEALAEAEIDLHSARNRIRQEYNLPLLEREPEREASSRKALQPFAAFMLLLVFLLLIYLIVRMVFP